MTKDEGLFSVNGKMAHGSPNARTDALLLPEAQDDSMEARRTRS